MEPHALDAGAGRPIDLGDGFVVAVKAAEHQIDDLAARHALEVVGPPSERYV